jgi:hypothetical protein
MLLSRRSRSWSQRVEPRRSLRTPLQKNRSFIDCEWSTIRTSKILRRVSRHKGSLKHALCGPGRRTEWRCNRRILRYDEERDQQSTPASTMQPNRHQQPGLMSVELPPPGQGEEYFHQLLERQAVEYQRSTTLGPNQRRSAPSTSSVKNGNTITGTIRQVPPSQRPGQA